jgi:phosphatidylglycerol:prolipoprotein diacylglycerol transferase
MHPILFDFPQWVPLLGGQPLTSFGVMMLLAFLTGAYFTRSEMARLDEDPEKAWDLVFMAVVGGIVGAKTYYILLNYHELLTDPKALIFSRGGLVWYGGFALATLMVIWEIRRQKLPLPKTADAVAPALAIAYAVGRIGCFLVGDDYGRPTGSWIGIRFPQGSPPTTVTDLHRYFGLTVDSTLVQKFGQVVPVYPTELFEVALSTLIFLFLWRIRRHHHKRGWLFMVWLILAGTERFLVEFLRAKDDRFIGIFTLAQMISVVVIAVGIVGATRLRQPPEPESARA